MRTTVLGLGAAGALAFSLFTATPAGAAGGELVQNQGPCNQGSRWELSIETNSGGGFTSDFDVRDAPVGDRWRIKMRHNGEPLFRGTAVTDEDGRLEVEPAIQLQAGPDTVIAKAVSLDTGERCSGTVTLND